MTNQYIHQLFDEKVRTQAGDIFIENLENQFTYQQLDDQVQILVTELKNKGVRLGDRILVVAENCSEHIALILAISKVGAWSCGVNARMSKGEINTFVKKADPRLIYFTSRISKDAKAHGQDYQAISSVLAGLECTQTREEAVAQDGALASQIAAIIFTSGTTGEPKGVLVSHAGLLKFAEVSTQSRELNSKDKSYAYVPMTHIFGLGTVLSASLYAGSRLVMRHAFDPADVFKSLEFGGITNLQGPPTMFSRLIQWLDQQGITHPRCPDLRYVYCGAAPLDMPLKKRVEEIFGMPLHHGYGLSEYAGAIALVKKDEGRADTSAGYVVDGGRIRIVNSEGQDLPVGEKGQILMKGIGLMPGYFRDPIATDKAIDQQGWYASGDIGYIDHAGAIFVVGRLKEMIIRSGFNVYPGELESILNAYPGVDKSAIVGQKEADGNEAVIAFIEPHKGQVIDEAALRAYLVDHLAPYKRPSKIIFREQFPLTQSGKILKRVLLEDLK